MSKLRAWDDIAELVKAAAQAEKVWEGRRFRVYRAGRSPLIVTLSDQRPGVNPSLRYAASAQEADSDDATAKNGNPDSTIEGALSNVHWWEFD